MRTNHGIIHENPSPNSGYLGIGIPPDIRESGDWTDCLPEFERQSRYSLETLNCVQFSLLNIFEITAKLYGKDINLSDRALSVLSGCTQRGNTFGAAYEFGLKIKGCCAESVWPWTDDIRTWLEYNAELPADVITECLKLLDDWDFGMRYHVEITLEAFKSALKKGPLWVCTDGHAFTVYRITDTEVHCFDHYPGAGGKGRNVNPISFLQNLRAAYIVPVTPKETNQTTMTFKEECMYQLVEGIGGAFIFIGGKMYRDTEAKILFSWNVRNCEKQADGSFKSVPGLVGTLTMKDIEGVQLFNLKGEPVTLGNPV